MAIRLNRCFAGGLALALTIASSSGRAHAGDLPEGQVAALHDLFTSATRDEDAHRYADALGKLQRVFALKPTAGVRFHLALCEEQLGKLVPALEDYARAEVQARPENENALDVQQLAPAKLAALRTRVPWLTIDVPQEIESSASVSLDGAPIARALWGVQMPVDPGEHRIEATARGRLHFSTTLEMAEHDVTVLTVKPPPESETTTTPATTQARAPQPAPATLASAPAPAPSHPALDRAPHASGGGKAAAIVVTVGAVVLAAAGVGAYLVEASSHDDAVSQCATRTIACDDLKQPVQTWDTLALSALIGAAALGVVAVVLWSLPSSSAASSATGRLVVGPGTAGIAGTF